MVHGYPMVKHLCGGLQAFMRQHNFSSINDFRGAALPYFTTHTDLVARQKAAVAERKAAKVGLASDNAWTGEPAVVLGSGSFLGGRRKGCNHSLPQGLHHAAIITLVAEADKSPHVLPD
jgi:hypothetical protein